MTCTVDLSVVGAEMRSEVVSLDEQNEVRCVQQEQDRSEDRPLGKSVQNGGAVIAKPDIARPDNAAPD